MPRVTRVPKGGPMGGVLSDDNFYPACVACDQNKNGLFTERNGDGVTWYCLMCGATWDRATGERCVVPSRGSSGRGRV